MYAVTAANYTAEGTANVPVDRLTPLWGCPVSRFPDDGLHFTAQPSAAILARMRMRKITTSAYYPNGNGGVERVNHTMAMMISMVVNERQDDWDLHTCHTSSSRRTIMLSAPPQVSHRTRFT